VLAQCHRWPPQARAPAPIGPLRRPCPNPRSATLPKPSPLLDAEPRAVLSAPHARARLPIISTWTKGTDAEASVVHP
jgi:hypothetical protein